MQTAQSSQDQDLTDLSSTLPDLPEPNISLDSTVSALARRFGASNQSTVLVGPIGSGKTVHLSQFVRQFPDRCFSYFLRDSYWIQRQDHFLNSLCNQMNAALGNVPLNPSLDTDRLKALFGSLCQKVIAKARRNKISYYFAVDGLDYAFSGTHGDRIIDLLPLLTDPKGLFFLGSVRPEQVSDLHFGFHNDEPHLFSTLETRTYLNGLGLSDAQLRRIHRLSDGIPGYLSVFRTLVMRGISVDHILETPADLDDLLSIQWTAAVIDGDEQKEKLFSLLAFSLVPLRETQIADMMDKAPADIRAIHKATRIVRVNKDNKLEFHNELLRRIARTRLQHLKEQALRALIDSYKKDSESPETDILLSEYYFETRNYEAVTDMLVPNKLISLVETQQDLSGARRLLRQACELAHETQNLTGLLHFGLGTAELQTLSDEIIGESEVMALVALERFEQALDLAYSAKLVETRVKLLSRIYIEMERKGRLVSRESIAEIEQMTLQIGKAAEPRKLAELAASIFPLLPDVATALIEQEKAREESQSFLDLTFAMVSINTSDRAIDEIVNRIQDTRLREMAVIRGPWLSKLSSEEVIEKAAQIGRTNAKEYLLRQWCLQNRMNANIQTVLSTALDAIISDPNYVVPLRHLRQLSEVLRSCPVQYRESLAKRFDIPNFTGLRSPIEERLRLELNLAEALADVSQEHVLDRFIEAYYAIDEGVLDLDVACYCFTRVLITLGRIDPDDEYGIRDEVTEKITRTFSLLLESSADQLEISRRILRSLASIDPYLAFGLAQQLNTVERREEALLEVATAHMHQSEIPISLDAISDCLTAIQSTSTRDEATVQLIHAYSRSKPSLVDGILQFLISIIGKVSDAEQRSEGLAVLIEITRPEDHARRDDLFSLLLDANADIDITWNRVESMFHQILHVSVADKDLAGRLYDEAKTLRSTSPLANEIIGSAFYELLGVAARASGYLDLSNEESMEKWNYLYLMIRHIPSRMLQAHMFARIALGRLRRGDKSTFDLLMRDHVLPMLNQAQPSNLFYDVVINIGAALFEYSRSDARKIIGFLPYKQRNMAWVRAALITLLSANIGDPLDTEANFKRVDLPITDKVCEILEQIDADGAIYSVLSPFTRAIESTDSMLTEQQRLDTLNRLEQLVDEKLPDQENIKHNGYVLVCKSAIERSRVGAAKRAKRNIKRQHPIIVKDIANIPNIADRAYVFTLVAADQHRLKPTEADDLIEKAIDLVRIIPNTTDRIARLDTIADTYSVLNKDTKAKDAISLAVSLMKDLQFTERDELLRTIIQTAHEIDPDFAAQLTTRLDRPSQHYASAAQVKSLDLAKSPQKLIEGCCSNIDEARQLPAAAATMLKKLVANRGVFHAEKVLRSGLLTMRLLDLGDALPIANWATETVLRQSSETLAPRVANSIVNSVLICATLLYELGTRIAFLSTLPSGVRQGFHGFAAKLLVFRVGERNKAMEWLNRWLQENADRFVKIYDPYFDLEQLWVLQSIPSEVEVTIGMTWRGLKVKPSPVTSREVRDMFNTAWKDRSDQDPPPTLLIIEDTEHVDEGHDRYMVTADKGLAIGTSLNGMGKKEFTVQILEPEDARHVENDYLAPHIDLSINFAHKIFFRLGEI